MGDFFKQRHWLHFLTALSLGHVCLGKSNFEGYDIFNCVGIGVCVGIFIGIVAGLWEWSQAYYVSHNYPLAETDGWDSADIIWSFVGGITGACFGALLQVDAIWWTALAVFVSCIGSEVLRILKVTK